MEGTKIGAIYAEINLKRDGFDADVNRVKRNMSDLTNHVKQNADAIKRAGESLTLGITAPLVAAGVASAKFAMQAVESENLFSVSMGKQEAAARKWSEELRSQLGLNAYEVRKNVGTFNVMLGSMGLTEKAAFDMSKGFTKLAYDMASFYNISPEQAFEKLRSGISGEVEPLKQLGIIVNETTTQNYAFTNGIAKKGEKLTEVQKVLARYGAIMEQTSKAQGDLARTIDSPTNKLRILQTQLVETSIQFGNILIPAISSGISVVAGFVKSLNTLPDGTKQVVVMAAAVAAAIGPMLVVIGNIPAGWAAATAGAKLFTTFLGGPWGIAITAATALIYGLVKGVQYLQRDTVAEAKSAADSAKAKADQAKSTSDLVAEYDRLSAKSNKTHDDHVRLNAILQKIAENNPGLIKAWDGQGNALGLVAGAATKAGRAYEYMYQQAVKAAGAELRLQKQQLIGKLKDSKTNANAAIAAGETGTFITEATVSNDPYSFYAGGDTVTLNNEQRAKAIKAGKAALAKSRELQSQLQQIDNDLRSVNKGILPNSGYDAPGGTIKSSTGAGSGKKKKGLTAKELAIMREETNLSLLELKYSGIENSFSDSLTAGNTAGASAQLSRMNSLADMLKRAENKVAGAKMNNVSTPEEKEKIEVERLGRLQVIDEKYLQSRKQLESKVSELKKKQSEKDKSDLETTLAANIKAEKTYTETMLAYYQATNDKKSAIIAETQARIDELLAKGVAPIQAMALAQAEANVKIAALDKELADKKQTLYEQEMSRIKKEQQARAALIGSSIDTANNLAETDLNSARALLAGQINEAIVRVRNGDTEASGELQKLIEAYQKLGKTKADDITLNEAWKRSYEDVLGNIRQGFVDVIANLAEGTNSFKDFFQMLKRQMLELIINNGLSGGGILGSILGPLGSALGFGKQQGKGSGVGGLLGSLSGFLGGGGIVGGILGGIGKIFHFDNPQNDTAAVRYGADFARLFRQGAMSDAARAFPTTNRIEPTRSTSTSNISNQVKISMQIDKVTGIADLEKAADTMAWMVNNRLKLVPTGS